MTRKLVYGIALNDANCAVHSVVGGKRIVFQFYRAWTNMLSRCYNKSLHLKHPNYSGCSVCDEWLTFSKFKSWMERQHWRGNHLDKDLINTGNKCYSPENCAFVEQVVNKFITERGFDRGAFLIGVSWKIENNKFQSQCSNPFTGKYEYLGYFESEIDAHLAWKNRKHELACQLAEIQTDERVANALRNRYL